MEQQMYYLRQRNSGEFFVGYEPGESRVRFYHSPLIAKKMTKDKAEQLQQELPARYDQLWGKHLELIPVEKRRVSGQILSYFLFDSFLLICRKTDKNAEADWQEIYESDRNQENKWYDLTERDRANGRLQMIDPEAIGALTEAPIIAFDVIVEDTVFGQKAVPTADSRIYWFGDYQVIDELEKIDEQGFVEFDRVQTEIENDTE